MIELLVQLISEPQLLAVFSYSCLNISTLMFIFYLCVFIVGRNQLVMGEMLRYAYGIHTYIHTYKYVPSHIRWSCAHHLPLHTL